MKRILTVVSMMLFVSTLGAQSGAAYELMPENPDSEWISLIEGEPPVDFCARWNPEYGARGFQCCSKDHGRLLAGTRGNRRRKNSCAPNRIKWTFCDERTDDQIRYEQEIKSGKRVALSEIEKLLNRRPAQAYCEAANGFLVSGRPIVENLDNRIDIRNPARCSNYGTDSMIGLLEWVAKEIKKEYHEKEFQTARLIIADISAPKGGCMSGRFGRRAHKTHTQGIDADIAFFNPRADRDPEERFTRNFFVASNWWLLKKIFRNPLTCVKAIFVDQKHIRLLEKYAKTDPEWDRLKPYIRHVRGHKDHFHIRVGESLSASSDGRVPGCKSDLDLDIDDEYNEYNEEQIEDSAPEELAKEEVEAAAGEAGAETSDFVTESTAEAAAEPEVEPTPEVKEPAPITLPNAHKLEPKITQKLTQKPRKKRVKKSRQALRKPNSSSRKKR